MSSIVIMMMMMMMMRSSLIKVMLHHSAAYNSVGAACSVVKCYYLSCHVCLFLCHDDGRHIAHGTACLEDNLCVISIVAMVDE